MTLPSDSPSDDPVQRAAEPASENPGVDGTDPARGVEQERNFLKTLVRALPDLVWLKDPDGVYLACNPRFERLYNTREADIVGARTTISCRGTWLISSGAMIWRRSTPGARAQRGKIWSSPTTGTGSAWRIKTPMYGEDGRLVGVLGVARDITDARRAQEALRERGDLLEHRRSGRRLDRPGGCPQRPFCRVQRGGSP
jgi:PAS domain S-box-containing protein